MIKRLYILFLLVLFSVNLQAEKQPDNFTYLTINDGLSYNTVNCIFRDSRGFMWFGTNDGLNKYDGYNFTVYRHNPENPSSIGDNRIYAIDEDANGNLWIGTRNGLNKYNSGQDSFERFRIDVPLDSEKAVNDFVRDIIVEENGQIWLGTLGKGLLMFSPEEKKFKSFASSSDQNQKAGNDVSSVFLDSRGRFWFANNAHGLNLLRSNGQDVRFYPFQSSSFDNDNIGKTIYEDRSGNIWVCTEGQGLYRFHEPENTFTHYSLENQKNKISNNVVKDIYQDKEGRYWIATDGGGLDVYDLSENEYFTYNYDISVENSLSSDAVYCIYGDEKNILWVGTFGGGINILDNNRKKFIHFTQTGKRNNELGHPSVLSFEEDPNGMIWIGTDGGGISRFDPDQQNFVHFKHNPDNPTSLGSNVVTDIYRDNEGISMVWDLRRWLEFV